MYERIKKWYIQKLWTATMVRNAVGKGIITQDDANEIISMERN